MPPMSTASRACLYLCPPYNANNNNISEITNPGIASPNQPSPIQSCPTAISIIINITTANAIRLVAIDSLYPILVKTPPPETVPQESILLVIIMIDRYVYLS